MTGAEQVLIEDAWCQQYPSHSVGASGSAPTARSMSAPATAPASASPTTGRRRSGQPLRRPSGRLRRAPDSPNGRGRRPSQPGPEDRVRPEALNGSILRVDPDTGERRPDNPARDERRRQRPPDRRLRPEEPVPLRDPPGHQRALDRRRRLGEVGGDQQARRPPPAPSGTSAGRATRAPPARATTTRSTWTCARAFTSSRAPSAHPTSLFARRPRSSPASPAPPAPRRSPALPSTTAAPTPPHTTGRCSSPTTRATASGRCRRRPDGRPRPVRHRDLRRRRGEPGRPADRPRRRSVLRRFQRWHGAPHQLPRREPGADGDGNCERDQRLRPARGRVRRHRLLRP